MKGASQGEGLRTGAQGCSLSGLAQFWGLDTEGGLDSQLIPFCFKAPGHFVTQQFAKNRLLYPRKRKARHGQRAPQFR